MEYILWDLDGTLIDSRKRIFSLFCKLTENNCLTFEEYWSYKKNGYNQKNMLELIRYEKDKVKFSRQWIEYIEQEELLRKDTLCLDTKEILQELYNRGFRMCIVTNRHNYANLIKQLKWLDIYLYFDRVISTYQNCTKDIAIKKALGNDVEGFLIGDSVEDMNAAKELNMQAIWLVNDLYTIDMNNSKIYHASNLGEVLKKILSNI